MLLLLMVLTCPVMAQTRAWLDRDRIALGETATLNIETDQAMASSPDYSPLLGDFQLSGDSNSRQFELINGVSHVRVLFAVALQPKREGLITIPPLSVGSLRTQPLTLTVSAPVAAPTHADGGVFIESEADAQEPYVQQAVGYTVRLYSATPLVSGQLDQVTPDGASLQRIGDDQQYQRDIGGRQYMVVERHYLLIPERSGTLTIPGAHFQGKGGGGGGLFDDLLGDGQRDLRSASAPRFLKVRAIPADASQPWLPLRGLTLRYLAAAQHARAGEAASVTIEATADGATAAQMPDLQLTVGDGAQVFPDPAQTIETFSDGRPHVRVTRKFSIVPGHAGTLHIGSPRLAWWDVRAGLARTASMPDIDLDVAPGANGFGTAPTTPSSADTTTALTNDSSHVPGFPRLQSWALVSVFFAGLWLLTLAWGSHRRGQAPVPVDNERAAPTTDRKTMSMADLKRALDHGALADVADVLCAMASPPVNDLDELCARLDDGEQRQAIVALQRARWAGDGDGVVTRTKLREAFKQGPRWRVIPRAKNEALPPLYPRD
ncbi:MAG: BatD family protein [Luteimonas sp.]